MTVFVWTILGALAGGAITWLVMRRRQRELADETRRLKRELEEEEAVASGFAGFNERMQEIKDERKQHILKTLTDQKEVSSTDIAKTLDVSATTAWRYLTELEETGRVERNQPIGRTVRWRLKIADTG